MVVHGLNLPWRCWCAARTHHRRSLNRSKVIAARRRQSNSSSAGEERRRRKRVTAAVTSVGMLFGINVFGALVHYDDELFRYYPLPIAIDACQGPSMLPDYRSGEVYLRDTLSHRLIWLNMANWRRNIQSIVDHQSFDNVSWTRGWRRGDVVTIYNPFTRSIVTKRIVGLEGDEVLVYGKDAAALKESGDSNCGVPRDMRFENPYCQRVGERQADGRKSEDVTIVVPKDHVWVEGDNPLYSTDSRHYGPLPVSSLRGNLLYMLWPSGKEED